MVRVIKSDADFVYCTSCGKSWSEAPIYSVVCDNMMFKLCDACLNELREQLNEMELKD